MKLAVMTCIGENVIFSVGHTKDSWKTAIFSV